MKTTGIITISRRSRRTGSTLREVEQALSISPILIYEQEANGESRYVYYGETASLRLLAVVLTERKGKIRVITAYELDAGPETRLSGTSRARGVNEWKNAKQKRRASQSLPASRRERRGGPARRVADS